MEQKLTIEHLLAYAAYELQVTFFDAERGEEKICGIELIHLPDELTILDSYYEYHVTLDEIKLLLLPLSELIPQDYGYINEPDDDSISLQEIFINEIEYQQVSVKNWIELLRNHYDVFGLLDLGLALNKSTYKIKE